MLIGINDMARILDEETLEKWREVMRESYDAFRYAGCDYGFNDRASGASDYTRGTYYNRTSMNVSSDPVYKACIADAEEYFTDLNIDILTKAARRKLSKDQKERVVAFLKNRLTYYKENGCLINTP